MGIRNSKQANWISLESLMADFNQRGTTQLLLDSIVSLLFSLQNILNFSMNLPPILDPAIS